MRTTELKINNTKKEAVLVAGGPGFKIYTTSDYEGWVLAIGKKIHTVDEDSSKFKLIAKYVNLRYQPIADQTTISNDFNSLIQSLKETSVSL